MAGVDDSCNYTSCCGSGHADEVLGCVGDGALYVKADQTPGAADEKGEATNPGKFAELVISLADETHDGAVAPGVGKNGWGDAEADDIGERIELHAKFGVGAGQASDTAIERVKENGQANRFRGVIEVFASTNQRSHGGVIAAEEIGDGKQAGQKKNAAPELGIA